ncbi:hypothetical protein FALBO_12816 [Fusarium albosuccineum]|uniref:Uncharacterized protein n=1 Tax=Fusarium albosuccineum TaxID=1237068 RepID=A0A8H4L369_9HYPO|nr:hypothetical protein FALBO_12816 [Fusarium albosuccineum]
MKLSHLSVAVTAAFGALANKPGRLVAFGPAALTDSWKYLSPMVFREECYPRGNMPFNEECYHEWACREGGGGGREALRDVHECFNKVFGTDKLRMAKNQCYKAESNNHSLAICNWSNADRDEVIGGREELLWRDPSDGQYCATFFKEPGIEVPVVHYYFSTEDRKVTTEGVDTRYC